MLTQRRKGAEGLRRLLCAFAPLRENSSAIQRLDRAARRDEIRPAERVGVVALGVDAEGVEHGGGGVPGAIALGRWFGAEAVRRADDCAALDARAGDDDRIDGGPVLA